jgi:DNA-directed RNA polymerase specialized sigma24 family protein
MDLEQLIGRAKQGDLDAFAEVTRRFQHMAFGYALSIVRDLQQAEDVVQEAFVATWFGLITLADPAAFPGWFRGIVRHQAYRQRIFQLKGRASSCDSSPSPSSWPSPTRSNPVCTSLARMRSAGAGRS